MTVRQKERHLCRLFLRVGNARGFKARWINYHIGWVHGIVAEGYYNRIKGVLEGALKSKGGE